MTVQGFKSRARAATGSSSRPRRTSRSAGTSREQGRPAGEGKTAGHPHRGLDRLVSRQHGRPQHLYGIYVRPAARATRSSATRSFANACQFQRVASGIRLYGSSGNTVSAQPVARQRGLGHRGRSAARPTTSSSTTRPTTTAITASTTTAPPGQRIIANTVYKNVTAGINVEGGSTGARSRTTSASTTASRARARTATSASTRARRPERRSTTTSLPDGPDTLVIWNSVGYNSLAALRSATGQERTASRRIRGSEVSGRDFRLLAASPAIDSANSGASGQPASDPENHERVDDPATTNTGAARVRSTTGARTSSSRDRSGASS